MEWFRTAQIGAAAVAIVVLIGFWKAYLAQQETPLRRPAQLIFAGIIGINFFTLISAVQQFERPPVHWAAFPITFCWWVVNVGYFWCWKKVVDYINRAK